MLSHRSHFKRDRGSCLSSWVRSKEKLVRLRRVAQNENPEMDCTLLRASTMMLKCLHKVPSRCMFAKVQSVLLERPCDTLLTTNPVTTVLNLLLRKRILHFVKVEQLTTEIHSQTSFRSAHNKEASLSEARSIGLTSAHPTLFFMELRKMGIERGMQAAKPGYQPNLGT
ncbi:unnamed protein product [Symbiodinium sp. CCMP2592]|nr:unnamed protein product [Symbiodinium sp. CCMP2592]